MYMDTQQRVGTVMQRYTLQELQVAHIKRLFKDVVSQVHTKEVTQPTKYVWLPLPRPVHGRVHRAIVAYTS